MTFATLLVSLAALAQTAAKPTQCISKARGIIFPPFDRYRVKAESIQTRHPPILSTANDRLYRTRIREAARSKPNFAGHYVIKFWGCGTDCSQLAIVDRETGKVYDPPFANVTYHYPQREEEPGWDCFDDLPSFSLTSRLFVVEGCLNESGACGRHFYVMEPSGLHEIFYDPDTLRNGKIAP